MDVYTFVTQGSCEILGRNLFHSYTSNMQFQKRISYQTVLFSCFLFTLLYEPDRNEGKLKGKDCINIRSDLLKQMKKPKTVRYTSSTQPWLTTCFQLRRSIQVRVIYRCILKIILRNEITQLVIDRRLISVGSFLTFRVSKFLVLGHHVRTNTIGL